MSGQKIEKHHCLTVVVNIYLFLLISCVFALYFQNANITVNNKMQFNAGTKCFKKIYILNIVNDRE